MPVKPDEPEKEKIGKTVITWGRFKGKSFHVGYNDKQYREWYLARRSRYSMDSDKQAFADYCFTRSCK